MRMMTTIDDEEYSTYGFENERLAATTGRRSPPLLTSSTTPLFCFCFTVELQTHKYANKYKKYILGFTVSDDNLHLPALMMLMMMANHPLPQCRPIPIFSSRVIGEPPPHASMQPGRCQNEREPSHNKYKIPLTSGTQTNTSWLDCLNCFKKKSN